MTPDLLKELDDAISAVKAAFGAPGNYGYNTPERVALYNLYVARAGLLAEMALTVEKAPPAIAERLADVLAKLIDEPLIALPGSDVNQLSLRDFRPDLTSVAAELLEEMGK